MNPPCDNPFSEEEFSSLVGISKEQSKVFFDLAGGNGSKAIEMYEKISNRTLSHFEVITQNHRPASTTANTGPATLFSLDNFNSLEEKTPILNHKHEGTVISFYTNGFTINHGPLRDFVAPQNRQFIEELQQGMVQGICPRELLSEPSDTNHEIKIRIERKNHPWNPFRIPMEKTNTKVVPIVPPNIHAYGIWIRKEEPIVRFKIGLPDNKMSIVIRCNPTSTIEEVLKSIALPLQQDPSRLTLTTFRPQKVWSWESRNVTIQDAGLEFVHAFLQIQ